MTRNFLTIRLLTLTLLLTAFSAPTRAQDNQQDATTKPAATNPGVGEAQQELPKIEEMQTPSFEELMTGKPRDWIVLNTDYVLVVDSLTPRPRTIELRQEEIAKVEEQRRTSEGEERDRLSDELNRLRHLVITLPESGDSAEFELPINQIKTIVHHEDLMLRRLNALLEAQDINRALEILMRLQRSREDWPGLKSAGLNILYADGGKRIAAGKPESALVVLNELYGRDKDFAGLANRFGQAIRMLVEEAITQENWLRAQYFLKELQQHYADHPVYQELSGRMSKLAQAQIKQAEQAADKGEHRAAAIAAEAATRIWPLASGIRAQHKRFTERYQRLHVGVLHLPGDAQAYPVPGPADERKAHLTELPLFQIDRVRDGTAYYRTRFFDVWEPRDLGRELKFTLRQFRQPYELQATVTTAEIVAPLLRCLDSDDPHYDERLAAFIESVKIDSPTEFTLHFRRVPARLEPLLARISLLAPDEKDATLAPLIDPGGFVVKERTEETISYVRKLAEPDGLPKYHLAEVVEHKYDSPDHVVQGLIRGEISMAAGLPDWTIRRLLKDDQFLTRYFIQQQMIPLTHLLQFNPASPALQVREMRLALAYGIDREKLLERVVLRDPNPTNGRLVTTPFLSTSPARNVLIENRRYDLSSSLALALAAQQKLKGGIPPLTLVVAPGAIPEAVGQELAASWRRIGLDIKFLKSDDPAPEQWDILYRTLQMTEPVVEMWPFLTFEERARIAALDVYPDWLKQELIDLDRTSDQSRAVAAMQQLHRHLWEMTAYIPLWEVDQYVVFRKNIQGFPQRPVHCYDEIDRWMIDAWYQSELP